MTLSYALEFARRYARGMARGGRFVACHACGQDLRLPPLDALEFLGILKALAGEGIVKPRTGSRKGCGHRRAGR